jgi:DnaJ-class molecular chaperone
MGKDSVPEKYRMATCPLCSGRGFLIKPSDQINITVRKVCAKCGGFGAIKKEEEVFKSQRS